jgi:hypothetical protein
VFANVVGHPATTRELQRVFRELREVSQDKLPRLGRTSARAADVVRLYGRFRELTAGFFDEVDLMESAADNLRSGSTAAEESGSIVLYLPRKLAPALARLLATLAPERVHAVLGLTGDATVDAVTEDIAGMLVNGGERLRTEVTLPGVTRLVSATDPEEEVREAIRQAMAMAAGGTPLHRIAISYESRENYAGLLDDALTSAGVPHNGPPNRTVAQTVPGRTVLGLPKIAASSGPGDPGYAREVVMDWLTSAPIFDGEHEAPSHRWDEISRDAGIVKGPDQWANRLELHAASEEQRAKERARDGEIARSHSAERPRAEQTSLGMTVRLLTPQERQMVRTEGTLVIEEVAGSAAVDGLRPGDIILGVERTPVKTVAELQAAIQRAGRFVPLRIQRGERIAYQTLKKE